MKYEPFIRVACFVGVLVLMGAWEAIAPRRNLSANKPLRWFNNLGLVALNSLVVRAGFALGAVGVAIEIGNLGWGLFNYLAFPAWVEVVLAFLALDLAIYLQHVLFHAVPALWRLHMVHHADPDFDVTTGTRFHTVEIVLSMGLKVAAIAVLGPSPIAVLLFELMLSATAMFNHSNVAMPRWLDRGLRLVVVTPDMHRVHHSTIRRETSSNFGFNLPWWDYLLGTYRDQPSLGHQGMEIGLAQFRDSRAIWLPWMLALPFVGRTGEYPINVGGGASREPGNPGEGA